MKALESYWGSVQEQLSAIHRLERQTLETAATWVAETLLAEKFVYVFGSGHSHTLSEEAFYRAGGLVRVVPILDENLMVHQSAIASTEWERKEGYAKLVLNRYRMQSGDLLFVVSSSGRNAVPVEMAMEGKALGARVIALTSRQYSSALPSRHSSGQKLMDVADLVIDNHSVLGDAVVQLDGLPKKIAPTSTINCAFIWNSIVAAAAEKVLQLGGKPEVWVSANSAAEDLNTTYVGKYRGPIPHL